MVYKILILIFALITPHNAWFSQVAISTDTQKPPLETPVLFTIFKRPERQQEVFNRIKQVRPKKLFVAADGPRNEQEAKLCLQAREILKQIDWECEVRILFREKNLGCKIAITQAVTWFFENVDEGIILEDDCVPSISFFYFCQEMLAKYRDDTNIFHINGYFIGPVPPSIQPYSYIFTRYMGCWGWASWKRAWQHFSINPKPEDIEAYLEENDLEKIFGKQVGSYLIKELTGLGFGWGVWGIRWLFTILFNKGICVEPTTSLIRNIGYGTENYPQDLPIFKISENEIDTEHLSHPPCYAYYEDLLQTHLSSLSKIKHNRMMLWYPPGYLQQSLNFTGLDLD